jgi:hypothetical protein
MLPVFARSSLRYGRFSVPGKPAPWPDATPRREPVQDRGEGSMGRVKRPGRPTGPGGLAPLAAAQIPRPLLFARRTIDAAEMAPEATASAR